MHAYRRYHHLENYTVIKEISNDKDTQIPTDPIQGCATVYTNS